MLCTLCAVSVNAPSFNRRHLLHTIKDMHLLDYRINISCVFFHLQKIFRACTHLMHTVTSDICRGSGVSTPSSLPPLHPNLYRLGISSWPSWVNAAREADRSQQRSLVKALSMCRPSVEDPRKNLW